MNLMKQKSTVAKVLGPAILSPSRRRHGFLISGLRSGADLYTEEIDEDFDEEFNEDSLGDDQKQLSVSSSSSNKQLIRFSDLDDKLAEMILDAYESTKQVIEMAQTT